MSDVLRIRFEEDADGTGELFVEVTSKGFSGRGSAWFDKINLITFAKKLAETYPLNTETPLSIEGGFWSKSGGDLEQIHVGLKFYPIGSTGQIGCRVSLATAVHSQERPESQSLVSCELKTFYEGLRTFAQSLEKVIEGSVAEALLEGVLT